MVAEVKDEGNCGAEDGENDAFGKADGLWGVDERISRDGILGFGVCWLILLVWHGFALGWSVDGGLVEEAGDSCDEGGTSGKGDGDGGCGSSNGG